MRPICLNMAYLSHVTHVSVTLAFSILINSTRIIADGLAVNATEPLEAKGRSVAVSQADLASQFGITSASRSTMTDRLLTACYLWRTANPVSQRQNVLNLTQQGRDLLKCHGSRGLTPRVGRTMQSRHPKRQGRRTTTVFLSGRACGQIVPQ